MKLMERKENIFFKIKKNLINYKNSISIIISFPVIQAARKLEFSKLLSFLRFYPTIQTYPLFLFLQISAPKKI